MRFHYIIKNEGQRAVSSDSIMCQKREVNPARHHSNPRALRLGWRPVRRVVGRHRVRGGWGVGPHGEVWAETTLDSKHVPASPNSRDDSRG